MRYDPHSRRYKRWVLPHDWDEMDLKNDNGFRYPRFTEDEGRKILRQLYIHGQLDPLTMGEDWNFQGPKVRSVTADQPRALRLAALLTSA